jgi:hypothetical protein
MGLQSLKAWTTKPSSAWRQRAVPQVANEGFGPGQTCHFVLGAGSYKFSFTQFVLFHLEAKTCSAAFRGLF